MLKINIYKNLTRQHAVEGISHDCQFYHKFCCDVFKFGARFFLGTFSLTTFYLFIVTIPISVFMLLLNMAMIYRCESTRVVCTVINV